MRQGDGAENLEKGLKSGAEILGLSGLSELSWGPPICSNKFYELGFRKGGAVGYVWIGSE